MRKVLLLALAALLLPWPAPAREEAASAPLAIALASDHVGVGAGFHGGDIVVFGVRADPGQPLAVTLCGPRSDVTVRRKKRLAGLWLGSDAVTFPDVPAYCAMALSDPSPAGEAAWAAAGVGLEAVLPPSEPETEPFRRALIDARRAEGLMPDGPQGVDFIAPGAFRVTFTMPPDVPMGAYTVRARLRAGSTVTAHVEEPLTVAHVGLEARIAGASRDWSWAYGLACVIMAAAAGWFAAVLSIRTS